MSKTFNLRELAEDASKDPAFSTGVILALATGNPLLMEYIEVEARVQLLAQILSGYQQELAQYTNLRKMVNKKSCIPYIEAEIRGINERLESYQRDRDLALSSLDSCTGENFKVIIRDKEFTDRKEAVKELWALIDAMEINMIERDSKYDCCKMGNYGGFDLWVCLSQTDSGREIFGTLRHLSIDFNDDLSHFTDFRIIKDAQATTERLEERFKQIISRYSDTLKVMETAQRDLEQVHHQVGILGAKISEIQTELTEKLLVKMTMEEQLGLNQDEMVVVEAKADSEED